MMLSNKTKLNESIKLENIIKLIWSSMSGFDTSFA